MSIEVPSDHVELFCESIRVSSSGLALYCDFGDSKVWIPISQIHDNSEVWEEGQRGDIIIPLWLAKEKELV